MILMKKVKSQMPISIDLKSMYSNVPLDEGLAAFKQCLEDRPDQLKQNIPTDWIMKLVRMIMTQNVFTFNDETWLQLLGCCMGSRVSPSYANLFMGVLEKKILENCPENLKQCLFLWKRYIDDCLIFWNGTWALGPIYSLNTKYYLFYGIPTSANL